MGKTNENVSPTLFNNTEPFQLSEHDGTDPAEIKCIFLCYFHPTTGPKILSQVPENYISKDLFRIVHQYVIPKIELQRSFLSVGLFGIKILGYPIRIDNKLYERNAFYFNVCFVFEPTTRTIGYEPIVRKLTEYLLELESTTKLLSQPTNVNQLAHLTKVLTTVRDDINKNKVCMLQEGATSKLTEYVLTLPLCVVPHYQEKFTVYPHQAPVLVDNFYSYIRVQWDLTTLRILPYVDGFSHINRIAAMADVALGLVRDCIKHLVLLGVAIIVPVFQYSNVYRPTPKLSQLAKSKELQRKCIEKCSKTLRRQLKVKDVFRFFASMAHGATFGELCVRFNPAALNINEKHMVLFGLMEGLIRSVNRYPVSVNKNLFTEQDEFSSRQAVSLGNENETVNPSITTTTNTIAHFDATLGVFKHQTHGMSSPSSKPLPRGERVKAFANRQNSCFLNNIPCQNFYTGLKSFDEICCATGMSSQQLENHLARDKHVIVLLK